MTTAQKEKWATIRDRVDKGFKKKGNILKQDLIQTWKLHFDIFGTPKHRPPINCCVHKNIETWLEMKNALDAAYKELTIKE